MNTMLNDKEENKSFNTIHERKCKRLIGEQEKRNNPEYRQRGKDFRSLETKLGENRLRKHLEQNNKNEKDKKVKEGIGKQRNYPQTV